MPAIKKDGGSRDFVIHQRFLVHRHVVDVWPSTKQLKGCQEKKCNFDTAIDIFELVEVWIELQRGLTSAMQKFLLRPGDG